ncbi:ribonuclease H-like domain-containing protein [Lentinula raphanica]|nr:ribonuclease H-like domain-containing protein [Lentinula raphanica]
MQAQASQPRIREVWAPNLAEELQLLRQAIETYPYIAMDTEFPGVVARPIGNFKTSSDYHYQTMRCNVDLLKIIQVGITLSDEEGRYPPDGSTWQFNFRFSLNPVLRHEDIGISPNDFAELMITSGLVLAPETRWISFHSGYDFGYFVRLLTAESLPTMEDSFFELLRIWFPTVYDIKFMMRATKAMKGGLQDLADDLGMIETYFQDGFDDDEYNGKLYGLGKTFTVTNGSLADTGRPGAATLAEREDRNPAREMAPQNSQTPSVAMAMAIPTIPSQIAPTTYAPMGNGPPYLRTSLVGGR